MRIKTLSRMLAAFILFNGFNSVWAASPLLINGAGATFPYPLYSKWFNEFRSVDPSAEINYQSIGSGGGIRQLLDKTIDFGASDAPMSDAQLATSKMPILHIPTVAGAVAVIYNLPGLNGTVKLTGEVLADIYLAKIQSWDDPRIAELNPGIQFPKGLAIYAAYRADGSGTTAVFSDYLSKVSPQWQKDVGHGTSLQWPTGLGGKGNEGVSAIVKQQPGAIGYVELTYAQSNKLPSASLRNHLGEFTEASVKSAQAAADGAVATMPADFRVSITDSPGKGAYPIASFTYILVYQTMPAEKGGHILKFLKWAITGGQKFAAPLGYAPLPRAMIKKVSSRLSEIRMNKDE